MPKLLNSDPDTIETVIINLATNAIKYTTSGFVIVDLAYLDAMKFRLDVHDSGAGIDTDLQPRIFDQFVRRVPSDTEDEGAVGLGLSLCKSLVELLGGDIGFKSERGRGSTFWAEFPAGCMTHSGKVDTPPVKDTKIASFGLDILSHPDIDQEFHILSGDEADLFGADQCGGNPHANVVLIADPSGMRPADQESLCQLLDNAMASPPLITVDSGDPSANAFSRRATAVVSSPSAVSPQLVRTVIDWHQLHLPGKSKSPKALTRGNRTILVADDNAMNRQVTGQMLKLDGYAVLEAGTGDDALEYLLEKKIDVALLDVHMADQDGAEICKTYQSVAARESAAVIVGLTADITRETRDRCIAAGMVDVLTKPLSLEDLRSLLDRIDGSSTGDLQISSQLAQKEVATIFDVERVNHLIELFGEDAFENDFLTAFEAETSKSVRSLQAGISLSHSGSAEKVLHAIKSGAKTIGASQLANHVSCLEDFQHDHNPPSSYESVGVELDIFMDACKAFVNHQRVQASKPFENAVVGRPQGKLLSGRQAFSGE
jgi:two-component system, sensor histidine kinase RpfC